MSFIEVERPEPSIGLLRLNRPERKNSMAFDLMLPLRDAIVGLSADNEVRIIVLTGAGSAFCSGADLEDAGQPPGIAGLTLPTVALRSMELLEQVVLAIRGAHQPVIAAVNGPAIGGGFCLALAADLRVAAPAAYFRAAGITNGLTATELGISYLLPRAIGSARAAELMLTGRDLPATEAERIGLVSSVVEAANLLEHCYALGRVICGYSRPGVELTKRMLWSSLDAASLGAHMSHEGLAQLFVRLTTRNFEEAVAARKQRRSPVFED
jgi:enoyl-CoA hydratase